MAWRLPALLAFALIAPANAAAVTNTVAVGGQLAMGSAPSATSPANTGLRWTMDVDTAPPGNQPDIVVSMTLMIPRPFILNAQDYPACAQSQVDGMSAIPPECMNAVVGQGSATIYAGQPGNPLSQSVKEDLTLRLINGAPVGSQLLIVLNSTPSAPVAITNRVVPGTIAAAAAPSAASVKFDVPPDLQSQLGLALSLHDVDATISGTGRPITVGGTTATKSYLQLPSCPDGLALRQLTEFKPPPTISSDGALACAMGTFPDPPDYPTAPYTSPRVPEQKPPTKSEGPSLSVFTPADGSKRSQLRPDRKGAFTVPGVTAECPKSDEGPCRFTATARRKKVTIARASILVAAGAKSGLRMRLTPAGRKLLRKAKRLNATTTLALTTKSGQQAVVRLKLGLIGR
jgi:hypothetical protein